MMSPLLPHKISTTYIILFTLQLSSCTKHLILFIVCLQILFGQSLSESLHLSSLPTVVSKRLEYTFTPLAPYYNVGGQLCNLNVADDTHNQISSFRYTTTLIRGQGGTFRCSNQIGIIFLQIDRQIDRYRSIDRKKERQIDRSFERRKEILMDRSIDRKKEIQINRQIDCSKERKIDKQID